MHTYSKSDCWFRDMKEMIDHELIVAPRRKLTEFSNRQAPRLMSGKVRQFDLWSPPIRGPYSISGTGNFRASTWIMLGETFRPKVRSQGSFCIPAFLKISNTACWRLGAFWHATFKQTKKINYIHLELIFNL